LRQLVTPVGNVKKVVQESLFVESILVENIFKQFTSLCCYDLNDLAPNRIFLIEEGKKLGCTDQLNSSLILVHTLVEALLSGSNNVGIGSADVD
jgi:hypothetical protein